MSLFPIIKVSRKLCLQLLDELPFASNPFDERFRFCIHIIISLSLIIGLHMYLSLLNIPDSVYLLQITIGYFPQS